MALVFSEHLSLFVSHYVLFTGCPGLLYSTLLNSTCPAVCYQTEREGGSVGEGTQKRLREQERSSEGEHALPSLGGCTEEVIEMLFGHLIMANCCKFQAITRRADLISISISN